ncbi:CHRD domain protein [compost metagenome]
MRGVLTRRDLVGPLQGRTLRDLIREIERGNTYTNVHTEQHPNGEIRGQNGR